MLGCHLQYGATRESREAMLFRTWDLPCPAGISPGFAQSGVCMGGEGGRDGYLLSLLSELCDDFTVGLSV